MNFEAIELEPQDPNLLALFARAFNDRGFQYGDQWLKFWFGNTANVDVMLAWSDLQLRAYQLQGFWLKPDGTDYQTWLQANGDPDHWPPPDGFRRFMPRVITRMAAPGIEGHIARFEVNIDANWRPVTPSNEVVYSGRFFKYTLGKWLECFERADRVMKYGTIRRGDYWGGHILTDIRRCINLSTIKAESAQWSTGGVPNVMYGWAGKEADFDDQSALDEIRGRAIANWGTNPPDDPDMKGGGGTYENKASQGFSGSMDKSLILVDASPNNKHGIGFLIPNDDGDSVKYQAPFSKTPGDFVALPPNPPDADPATNAVQVSDGEDSSKWVKILRIWEPATGGRIVLDGSEGFPLVLDPLMTLVKANLDTNDETGETSGEIDWGSYSAGFSTNGKSYGTDTVHGVFYIALGGSPLGDYDDQLNFRPGKAVVVRTSVGKIYQISTIAFNMDTPNSTFCTSIFPPSGINNNLVCLVTGGPMAMSTTFKVSELTGSAGASRHGYLALVYRETGVPYIQGGNGETWGSLQPVDVGRKIKREVTFLVGDFDAPADFNANLDSILPATFNPKPIGWTVLGQSIKSDAYEVYGQTFGSFLFQIPATWPEFYVPPPPPDEPPYDPDPDNDPDTPPPPQPPPPPPPPPPPNRAGYKGYGPAAVIAISNYDIDGGFIYREGYNGP